MTLQETRKRILEDDEFVYKMLKDLAVYYNLKHTIRWANVRGVDDTTESVAEHVYGLHVLIDYLVPLIDPESKLDQSLMHSYATWHDMAEAIVSDMTNRTKTEQHKQAEKEAEKSLVNESADYLRPLLEKIFNEYDDRTTPEARLVKALDKIEPMFHLYFLTTKGYGPEAFDLGWPAEKYREHRKPYIEQFELLVRFDNVLFERTRHLHPE